MTIQAIPTRYKGYHFRSRLEARWAVFFDTLGIQWEYEPQGYEVGTNTRVYYLPDFWLPGFKTWVEVKGTEEALLADSEKLLCAMDWDAGLPHTNLSMQTRQGGILLLGPIPQTKPETLTLHSILTHGKGVYQELCYFTAMKELERYRRYLPIFVGDSSGGGGVDGYWDPNDALELLKTYTYKIPSPIASAFSTHLAYQSARSARFEHGQSGAT